MHDWSVTTFAAPAAYPVTLAQAKKQLEIPDDITDDDTYINSLISAATKSAEFFLARRLITQTIDLNADCFPLGWIWELPEGPLQSITSITYLDIAGNSQTLAATVYGVDTKSFVPRIYVKQAQIIPATQVQTLNAVTIRAVVGYGADNTFVPPDICHALKMTIAEVYKQRENTSEIDLKKVNVTVESLLTNYKARWF